jgi:hypothetical protein
VLSSQIWAECIPLEHQFTSIHSSRTDFELIVDSQSSRITRSLLRCTPSSPKSQSIIHMHGTTVRPKRRSQLGPLRNGTAWFAFLVSRSYPHWNALIYSQNRPSPHERIQHRQSSLRMSLDFDRLRRRTRYPQKPVDLSVGRCWNER